MRPLVASAASLALLLSLGYATACGGGDDDAGGAWALDRPEYSGTDGVPFLSPGNDSRFNLQYLLFDARQAGAPGADVAPTTSPEAVLFSLHDLDALSRGGKATTDGRESDTMFADGEGTRCVSDAKGRVDFVAAAQADASLSAADKTSLADERARVGAVCAPGSPPAGTAAVSPAAHDFVEYLAGAQAFYGGDFDHALERFGRLGKATNPWLRETARYMVGRALLNKAQVGAFKDLDGVAEPKVTDTASLTAAETELSGYLAAYPAGRYAASARGLLRRFYWLAGDASRLSAEYGWRIAHPGDPQANLDDASLAQEIDSKYLDPSKNQSHDPNLLAVADLMRLRGAHASGPPLSAAELEGQATNFAGKEPLFAFLRAARAYYIEHDIAKTLGLLGPPDPATSSYVGFSREVLRGQALMASGDYAGAAEHWKGLLAANAQPLRREALELGLAMSWERGGTLNKVFAADTRIASPRIREVLLRDSAGPILLRQAVADPQSTPEERALARFTLLFKEATRGHYSGFLRDFAPDEIAKDGVGGAPPADAKFLWAGEKEPFACPALKAIVTELAAKPDASRGLICLADFVRVNNLEDADVFLGRPTELGGFKSIFPGEPFSRGDIYKKLIAETGAPDDVKAYALYRIINCYGPSGNNACGGKTVDVAQRKAWFRLLKTKYGATSWAQASSIYW
jgi:hypothetical protein